MEKNINTKANYYFQLLIMFLLISVLMGCSNINELKNTSKEDGNQLFDKYLDLFNELNNTDTVCLDCQYLDINVNDTTLQIGKKQYCQFTGSFIPLFKTFPLYKIQYPEGYLTLLFHYYDAVYVLIMYVEAISYNLNGVITSREVYPAWNGCEENQTYAVFTLSHSMLVYSLYDINSTETKTASIHFDQQNGKILHCR